MSTEKIDEDYVYYLRDLAYIPESKWMHYVPFPEKTIAFIKSTLEYISFTYKMFIHILLSLLTNLTLPISQPFNFFTMVASIFIVVIFLFPLNIVLLFAKLFNDCHTPKLYNDDWKRMLAKGSEPINNIVRNGRKALGLPVPETCGPKIFDLDMAETLLILSTIIYQQEPNKVREIHKKLKHLDHPKLGKDCYEAHECIHKQAKEFGLEFLPLSELGCLDSLFAGMYWSEEDNFIVVVFKGTTPTNFSEWLSDFLFIREDARNFVFGEIHKGFYENFFPKTLDENETSYPALRMVETIRLKACEIYEKQNKQKPVNIWVTGHSLGAALAQVFYARLIKSNDFPEQCVLRDAFIFAGPAVGDKDFAFAFNGAMNKSFEEQKNLWRIVNTNDIVPRVPPSHLLDVLRRYIMKNDILNYFKIGDEICLYLNSEEPKGIILRERMKLDRKIDEKLEYEDLEKKFDEDKHMTPYFKTLYDSYDRKDGFVDSIYDHEFLIPSFIRNHLPHRYFMAMERLRSEDVVPMTGFL